MSPMRVLLLAPYYDRNTPGESWSTYKWVEGISQFAEVTVLTQHKKGWDPQASPTNAINVVNWDEPVIPGMQGRIAWELKPGYIWYYLRARRWIRRALAAGERFDLIHQINPLALRYPTPAHGFGIKYLIGPLAGSLPTPPAFRDTTKERQWYRKLRSIDSLRIKYDPLLHRTYRDASCILGVAPYVEEFLRPCRPKRFEIMAETGIETVASEPKAAPPPDRPLRLLFVGRLIRTKGIVEAIEAVNQARHHASITFDIVGDGDLRATLEQMVATYNLGETVRLHGKQNREQVTGWYKQSDVFLFPSYREPSGNVVFEALSLGLPVIASSIGGPGYLINSDCGVSIEARSRSQFISDLADSITAMARNPIAITTKSTNAINRAKSIASWSHKNSRLKSIYNSL